MDARAPQTLAVAFPSHQPRTLTGVMELSLAEIAWSNDSRPVRVSRVLELMLESVGGEPVSMERVRCLASSAREWLLQRVALMTWQDKGWFQARCQSCAEDFDLPVTLGLAARKSASGSFPVISVNTSLGRRRFEAPNGAHEESLAADERELPLARKLVALCGLEHTAVVDAECFTEQDLEQIEAAFDVSCPDIADAISTQCPICNAEVEARIDPMQFAFPRANQLLRDVHAIASVYHWSEMEILALPMGRRAIYADQIRTGSGGRR